MAPTGINIDPNLMVNAQSRGASDSFNYGPQANAIRTQQLNNQTIQTEFNYGSGAEAERAARTEYNYGNDAQTQRERQSQYLYGQSAQDLRDSTLATEALARDVTMFDLSRRKTYFDKVETEQFQNAQIASQIERSALQAQQAQVQSPAGAVQLAQIAEANAIKATSDALLNANNAKASVDEGIIANEIKYGDLLVKKSNATIAQRTAIDSNSVLSDLSSVAVLDQDQIRQGNQSPDILIDKMYEHMQARPHVFNNAQVGQQYMSFLNNLETRSLTPNQLGKIKAIKTAVSNRLYADSHVNTIQQISSAATAAQTGQASAPPELLQLNADFSRIGIDVGDPESIKAARLIKDGDGYRLANTLGSTRSNVLYTEEEFTRSPFLQQLYRSSAGLDATKGNDFDLSKRATAIIENLNKNPLVPKMGQSLQKLLNSVAPEVDNYDETVMQLSGSYYKLQQDIAASVPLFSSEGAELRTMLNLDTWLNLGGVQDAFSNVTGLGDLARFDSKIQESPELGDSIVEAYTNRATAGLPPALYNARVKEIVSNILANNSSYRDLTDPDARKAVEARVVGKVKRSLMLPQDELALKIAYERVMSVRGQTPGDTTAVTKGASFLSRLKNVVYGDMVTLGSTGTLEPAAVARSE